MNPVDPNSFSRLVENVTLTLSLRAIVHSERFSRRIVYNSSGVY